uniref:MOK protein kinase n=1 Tax=Urocitellus parryii TaxID=9999 RepID=A0A8D2HHV3_UROPR
MDLWSAGCVFYEIASLQPLFPGANELDQISKIHDVIGTPAQKTLTKFKQSRAMSFDFPFKKGSGIPQLTTTLSPQCLSLLHAMVAYDPDERIAAHQALLHPYFQEQRVAEKHALASHRRAFFPEHPMGPELLGLNGQFSKEGRRQPQQTDFKWKLLWAGSRVRSTAPHHRSARPSGCLPACPRPATLAWLQRGSPSSSSVPAVPRVGESERSGVATLQFHLENWPGLGMTISPANKAVYINPARHRGAESPVLTLRQQRTRSVSVD